MGEYQPAAWGRVIEEIRVAADDLAELLRSGVAPDAAVPGLTWNVGELAGHLVAISQLYGRMFEEGPLPLPNDGPKMNAQLIADLAPAPLAERAEQLVNGIGDLLDLYGDGSSAVPHWVRSRPAVDVAGIVLSELVVHRVDLERAVGRPTKVSSEAALMCLDGLYPAAPDFVDRDAARKASGTYHTRLRGGGDWTQRLEGGHLTVNRGLHGRPDLTINADPATLLLVSLERVGQIRANFTGGIVAYGRKPWKGLAFSQIFQNL